MSLNLESLWWSKTHNTIYQFGGEVSAQNGSELANRAVRIASVPPESIWQFEPDGRGSGEWTEISGPIGKTPYPPASIATAYGASTSDGERGYHIGGYASPLTSRTFENLPWATLRQQPGFQTFDFDTLSLTNTSDGGFFACKYYNKSTVFDPGHMIFVPSFGVDGVIPLLGGSSSTSLPYVNEFQPGVGLFNNITIYDLHTQSWLWQTATSEAGSPPIPRGYFCAVGVQGGNNSTYEM